MENNNQVRLKKIPLGIFIQALLDIYNMGIEYADLIGVPGEEQDTIGIAFSEEYMSDEMDEQTFEDLKDKIKDIKLSDDDLNQLL